MPGTNPQCKAGAGSNLKLDNLAFRAFGSMKRARRWLDASHADLGGLTPEQVAKTAIGLRKVKRLLHAKLGI